MRISDWSSDVCSSDLYWLGETYYVRQRYQDAAVAFLEGYQKYPKSPKAADNLLKLGMALGQVGQKAEACTTFEKLQQEFPAVATNIRRRLIQETQKLQCGCRRRLRRPRSRRRASRRGSHPPSIRGGGRGTWRRK